MSSRAIDVGEGSFGKRSRGRPRTPQLHEKILQSAQQLFGEREFHLVLTDEVAARAGVGKGSVYREFGSKEALYAAAVIDGFARLQDEIREALQQCESVRERIATVIERTLRYFWNRRQFFTILRDPGALPKRQAQQYFAQREQLSRIVRELLAEGIEAGTLRDSLAVGVAAESLLGMLRGINFYREDRMSLDDAVSAALSIFLDGCCDDRAVAFK
jgi:AcrR family transcriptional regulator